MTKQQKRNYLQEITFLVIASFGTLLKCYQLFYGNKEDVKKKIIKKSYINRNNNVNILSKNTSQQTHMINRFTYLVLTREPTLYIVS